MIKQGDVNKEFDNGVINCYFLLKLKSLYGFCYLFMDKLIESI